MTFEPKLDRALVVVDTDFCSQRRPAESSLIRRALRLAKQTGCELELFSVRDDASLTQRLFAADVDVARERKARADREATRIAEIAMQLELEDVVVRHETRVDHPRGDAILRKVAESKPDVVMKRAGDHSYVMGLTTNTDWDLIRRSPSHVWFVHDEYSEVDRIITAIGTVSGEDEVIDASDYDVFREAHLIAEAFSATHCPVHTYQVPQSLVAYASYTPDLGDMNYPAGDLPTPAEHRRDVARTHGRAIHAFAKYFHLDPRNVRLAEGHPADVLPELASTMTADLVVMGARNLSRWQRAVSPVAAESVLADATCDVLYVKDRSATHAVAKRSAAAHGEPLIDVEQAIIDPAGSFSSPRAVAEADAISIALRIRILDAWEHDIRALLLAEGEGGSGGSVDIDRMDEINEARGPLVRALHRARQSRDSLRRAG